MAEDKQILITKSGLKKLQEELDHYRTTRRKEIADRLKEAISYGDLSENSEYEEAKNEQAFVEGRILELEIMIKNAKIISDEQKQHETIQIGNRVKVRNLTDDDEPEIYTIVGSTEASPTEHKISNESPIGSAILGKAKGEIIKVKVPAGIYEYKILEIK
ncbi:transcription elongation factor GreA [Candidatus Peregrinibacteria bacterium]|nr:transcription elongation factor GreA [Candidatus Peregrinibacteria bacterium]